MAPFKKSSVRFKKGSKDTKNKISMLILVLVFLAKARIMYSIKNKKKSERSIHVKIKILSEDWNIIKKPVPSRDVLKFLRICVIKIIASAKNTLMTFIPIRRSGFLAVKEKIVCIKISSATIIIM